MISSVCGTPSLQLIQMSECHVSVFLSLLFFSLFLIVVLCCHHPAVNMLTIVDVYDRASCFGSEFMIMAIVGDMGFVGFCLLHVMSTFITGRLAGSQLRKVHKSNLQIGQSEYSNGFPC